MHIDAHQHFWVYDPREYDWIDDSMAVLRRDFLPSDLRPELERTGFHRPAPARIFSFDTVEDLEGIVAGGIIAGGRGADLHMGIG